MSGRIATNKTGGGQAPEFMSQNEARNRIAEVLHAAPAPAQYDNTQIWAGHISLHINGDTLNALMSHIYIDTAGGETSSVRISVEFFFDGVTNQPDFCDDSIDARLWLDINDRGFLDEAGTHHPPLLRYEPMRLMRLGDGLIARRDGSVVFVSGKIEIRNTGVFDYTVSFSADSFHRDDPAKQWVAINDIAHNRDGLIVVSDSWVKTCPSVTEICLRKFKAILIGDKFVSGKIRRLTEDLENIPAEIIYLLPFFLPGVMDKAARKDVRKGELGSIYAVKDFFKIDPALVSSLEEINFSDFIKRGLISDSDITDLLTKRLREKLPSAISLSARAPAELVSLIGKDILTELIGRAEMRALTQKAHSLGKKVIFDLVVMQTSRDSALIEQHPEWYSLDENGRPKTHGIAWLKYTDVALFDLAFNEPLQNYLGAIAPYWVERCGFDGVRIDASQTVDRPFLKQVKNRICAVKPGAIVLGETLCPMEQALDVPADMIYTLLVDHHVHTQHAHAFFNIFEEIHRTYEKGTVGMAYFENHDSDRATLEWHRMYNDILENDAPLKNYWAALAAPAMPALQLINTWDIAYFPALLKNAMSSLINMTAGTIDNVLFSYGIELGTDYGEESRTDFENPTLLYQDNRKHPPHSLLHDAYRRLEKLKASSPLLHLGRVYYFRNSEHGADETDKLLAYCKYDSQNAIFIACNLDIASAHQAVYRLPFLDIDPSATYRFEMLFNSFAPFKALCHGPIPKEIRGKTLIDIGLPMLVAPLCSSVIEMKRV